MKVLHLGKFYPPAKGGMEAIVRLICRETTNHVQNRVLAANDRFARVEELDGAVEVVRLAVDREDRRRGRLSRFSCAARA